MTYPCFIKPNISKSSSKKRMRKCDSEVELRGYLTEFSEKKDIEMLVEDYVEIAKEYSLLGVSTRQGTIGTGLLRCGRRRKGRTQRRRCDRPHTAVF